MMLAANLSFNFGVPACRQSSKVWPAGCVGSAAPFTPWNGTNAACRESNGKSPGSNATETRFLHPGAAANSALFQAAHFFRQTFEEILR
jgi:hypothetical protein